MRAHFFSQARNLVAAIHALPATHLKINVAAREQPGRPQVTPCIKRIKGAVESYDPIAKWQGLGKDVNFNLSQPQLGQGGQVLLYAWELTAKQWNSGQISSCRLSIFSDIVSIVR